jgi:uncharacterized RDD family membrane protein YckC
MPPWAGSVRRRRLRGRSLRSGPHRPPLHPPASAPDRFAALLLDQLPLVAVTIAILVNGIAGAISRGQGFAMTFPPFVALEIGDACVSFAPFQCGHEGYQAAGLLSAVGVPAALGWSIVGLALMEARTGTTPGKRRRGLRVVLTRGCACPRRRPSLGEQRRILDLLTGTRVVVVDREEPGAGSLLAAPQRALVHPRARDHRHRRAGRCPRLTFEPVPPTTPRLCSPSTSTPVEDALKQVESAGGSVVRARTEIPGMVAFASFKDPEGNTLGLWENA